MRSWQAAGVLLLAASISAAPRVQAGNVSAGARYGWLDAEGELFEGSGELGRGTLAGIQLEVGVGPLFGIEVAGEYVSEKLEFSDALLDSIRAQGEADYDDVTLYLTGRLHALQFGLLPLTGYIGGGLNVHYAEVTVDDAQELLAARAGEAAAHPVPPVGGDCCHSLEQGIAQVSGPRTRGGWHAVAGLRLAPQGIPFFLFVEARYAEPFDEDLPHHTSAYGGISITL
jgi:hypothetical protein